MLRHSSSKLIPPLHPRLLNPTRRNHIHIQTSFSRQFATLNSNLHKSYYFYHNSTPSINSDGTTSSNSLHVNDNLNNTTGTNIVDIINEINDDQKFEMDLLNRQRGLAGDEIVDTSLLSNNESANESLRRLDEQEEVRIEAFIDSNKVYKDLVAGGFTDPQAEVILDLMRTTFKHKLDWLVNKHVPKVDLENEQYLFQGAQSELQVEISNNRELSITGLTNSSIILKRVFNTLQDETSSKIQLNDNSIKMELNQFTHENNLHQKQLNIKNHDLNNKIISELMSGLRSEIESFRWQLTRSGIMAILILAVAILGGWNITKKIDISSALANAEGVPGVDEPLLRQIHDPSDEESRDYEADWDENVQVLNQYIKRK